MHTLGDVGPIVVGAAMVLTVLDSAIRTFILPRGASTPLTRREVAVARMATLGGTPPSGVELLTRYSSIGWNDRLPDLWAEWEVWFAELSETHTSLAVMSFFRSPSPHRSWVTAAGAVLDAASLAQSTLSRRGATSPAGG